MHKVRLLIQGEVHDVEGYAAFAKRMRAQVEAYEPETLVWELFGDATTGKVVWHEIYASPAAYLFHMRNMEEWGFFEEFVRQTRNIRITSLTHVVDQEVWRQLHSFHADFLHGLAGVVR